MAVTNPEELRSNNESDVALPQERQLEILAFMLEDEEYGVDIMSIREIIRPVPITLVPRVPEYILGIISLRGRILPVYDLRSRLKLDRKERSKNPRYIVLNTKLGLVGLVADTVTGVVRIPESGVDPTPSVINGEEGEFIRGVAKQENRLVILLNVERVIYTASAAPTEMRDKSSKK